MAKYTNITLKEAAIKALENARLLLGDAMILADAGSFGRALSLLVISREEAQKSVLLSYCAVGVYDSSDSLVGREIRRALEDHDYKHQAAWYVNVFANYALEVIARSVNTQPEKHAELEVASEKTVNRLKKLASPKGKRLEHMKWRGLYVGIDASGNITHPFDITTNDYEEFKGIAVEHHLYATFIHRIVVNAKSDAIDNYKLHAEQFRLIFEKRPLSEKQIAAMIQAGELNDFMAGFAYYLVRHNMFL